MKRLLLTLIFFAAMAQASNWVYAVSDVKEGKWYVDLSSVHYRQSWEYVTVWLKYANPDGSYSLIHDDLHITADQYRVLAASEYGPDSSLLRSSSTPTPWNDIVPDSALDFICRRFFKDQPRQSKEY